MKVLLVNGSPHEKGCTFTALTEVANTLNAEGVETELIWIGAKMLAGCMACGLCKTTGECFGKDIVNELIPRIPEFDGFVFGSPVYYAGPSGQLTAFMDRFFHAGSGFQGKLGAAVVSCRRGGASAAFDRLNKYFTINSMPVVSSQYWNQVHGFTPDDVRKDEEGMQTMRTLGRNMAWLLKCIQAGREKGVEFPEAEPRVSTHFIR